MSNFAFINDSVLRSNLDITFDHIINLITLRDAPDFRDKPDATSSFAKTILIYTVSIIEALLISFLKKSNREKGLILREEWIYKDIKLIYEIDNHHQAIAGIRCLTEKNLNKIDLFRIIDYCKSEKLVSSELAERLHKTRLMRNKMHIGTLATIDSGNSDKDLEFVFSVAKDVKGLF
jgi:hypothetical protein